MVDPSAIMPTCVYCNVSFETSAQLREHCHTETHELMVMSDAGRDWSCRPPPRGFKPDNYTLCSTWEETGNCNYGNSCVEAHGKDELSEWKERFEYREMRLNMAQEKQLYGKSYSEKIWEDYINCGDPQSFMKEKLDRIEETCSSPLSVTVSSKNSVHEWNFAFKTSCSLKGIALLQDTHRNHFRITKLKIHTVEHILRNQQEWLSVSQNAHIIAPITYLIQISFTSNIYGTFRQSIVFDFQLESLLVKHFCVDLVPDLDLEKINVIRNEISAPLLKRWTKQNTRIVPFRSDLIHLTMNDKWETQLIANYPCPHSESFLISQETVNEKKFTKNNYKYRMHELLFIEEIARYKLITQYNLATRIQVVHSYMLSPNSTSVSSAKYSSPGELFGVINLGKDLSEDSCEGRMILMHSQYVYFCVKNKNQEEENCTVYEALIEDKTKNTIYLRLSADTVKMLKLSPDCECGVQIQFQLNRTPYCQCHYTLDRMTNVDSIFPETFLEPQIPWTPERQWSKLLDNRLNLKQKEAVVAITTPLDVRLPPILVIGPFGTGKTFTLALTIRELIRDPTHKVLLCTHSNSAADLYIKDYFHDWKEKGMDNLKPLRIYYEKRWVATVNPSVQKYCLVDFNGTSRNFILPSRKDIMNHNIIVVTLSTSIYLSKLDLPNGYFTHILVDEAAQALECETIAPLILATKQTRVVLAGDHMQMGPDIFSTFAKERKLDDSLLERLCKQYPKQFPCKIMLCENYRSHETIIDFTSSCFYEQKLVSRSKQPVHRTYFPITFFTAKGEDVQDKNSTAFYNNSEVYEVVERVNEIKTQWPNSLWGEFNDQSIGVVTPYSDQVFRIRSELRKRRIDKVCVERVQNVQGKQFRVIVLSTVRTRKTCNVERSEKEVDFGFLSNSKLLNTAITRAQSLVAVVGDPVALCSLGRCSKIWEKFIKTAMDNNSLYGITWSQLKLHLDGIELKKIYTLNPLAPEFVPRKYRGVQAAHNSYCYPNNMYIPYRQPLQRPFPNPVIVPLLSFPPPHSPAVMFPAPPPPTNGISVSSINPPTQAHASTAHRTISVPQSRVYQNQYYKQHATQDNNLIQFKNNVHFPRRPAFNECLNLLPENMSLADMLQQPAQVQERWYNNLKCTVGLEAAENFKFLIQATNQKGNRTFDIDLLQQNVTPNSSPTFHWFDSPSIQINIHKPVYMRENGGTSSTSSPPHSDHSRSSSDASELSKHINEEFSNLRISNDSDVLEIKSENNCRSSSSASRSHFSKFFSGQV